MPSRRATTQGIKDLLKMAETEEEIQELLRQGAGYENPSDQTRNQWEKIARKRREIFAGEVQK